MPGDRFTRGERPLTDLRSRFAIERELGRGGMGVVYLARDAERDGLEVALKRLNDGADADALAREFAVARELRHPVIVRVLDFGSDADGSFLTMEYVAGADLSALAEPAEPERVTRWATLLADALEYARRRGLVHGDLKPANVRVVAGEPDEVRLLDLGLASLSGTRAAGGTPAYLAPEVLSGGASDARSDLFSLGCVLYQSLTLRPPFTAADRSPPEPLPEAVPERLREVISRLLARRPDDRPGRPADLLNLLGDGPGLRLPLPDGELVGRDAVLEAVAPGSLIELEAEEGMGTTRLLREVVERAVLAGQPGPITFDHGVPAAGLLDAETVATYLADGRAVVIAVRPGSPARADGLRLPLEPLDEEETLALVESRLPLERRAAQVLANWVHRESGGRPALAIEVLECLRDAGLLARGPDGLELDEAGLLRFEPPDLSGGRAARAVARLPPEVRARAAELAVDWPAGESPPRELVRAGLVLDGGAGYRRFASESVRRALEASLPRAHRTALASAAADREIAVARPDPARVARLLVGGDRGSESGPWALEAARLASSEGDHREALRWFEVAVEHLGPERRSPAEVALAATHARLGDADAALAALDRARAGVAADSAVARDAWVEEAEIRIARQDGGGARLAAVEAIRRARTDDHDGRRVRCRALLVLGRLQATRGRFDAARRHLEGALCLAGEVGESSLIARAGNALGNISLMTKHYDEAVRAYERALAAATESGESGLISATLTNLGGIYASYRRGREEAVATVERAVAISEEDGDPSRLARNLLALTFLEFDQGRADQALRHLERAVALHERLDNDVGIAVACLADGEILTALGEFSRAEESLNRALTLARGVGEEVVEAGALEELGRLALEQSKSAEARSYLTSALAVASRGRGSSEEIGAMEAGIRASLGRALLALGADAEAAEVLSAIPSDCDVEPDVAARIARARSELMMREESRADAIETLERTTAALSEAGFELELARTLLLLGPVLAEERGREQGLEVLERAREVFDRHGAKPSLARTLLAKAKIKAGTWL